jgi:Flp pilus assembly protein TadD
MRTDQIALACLLAASAGGCIHLPRQLASLIKVHPVQADVGPARSPEDRLYADAVKAIDNRDYGEAISLLQVARDGRPGDPRVLTAMGVVYDKLGRFDLSDRYYDQAEKADPGSKIVALDRKYSMFLRSAGRQAQDLANGVALAQSKTAAPKAAPGEVLYAQAVESLKKHEYGEAIGALRQARDAMPGDARVLAALGVAYDHLGRFDLSSRYYDQADKADPGSAMVAANRRNSLLLQQHGGSAGPNDAIIFADKAPSTERTAAVTPSSKHGG